MLFLTFFLTFAASQCCCSFAPSWYHIYSDDCMAFLQAEETYPTQVGQNVK